MSARNILIIFSVVMTGTASFLIISLVEKELGWALVPDNSIQRGCFLISWLIFFVLSCLMLPSHQPEHPIKTIGQYDLSDAATFMSSTFRAIGIVAVVNLPLYIVVAFIDWDPNWLWNIDYSGTDNGIEVVVGLIFLIDVLIVISLTCRDGLRRIGVM